MLQLLVVALLAAGVVAEDAKPAKVEQATPLEAQPAELAEQTVSKDADTAEMRVRIPLDERHENDHLYLKAKLDGDRPQGPIVARNLPSDEGHRPNIAAQDEIIRFTYSPAYYEPQWVLDYRFLKSGGRRYTRGPGGQILILPRSYRHHPGDGTHDYDSMIEHLRLKLIAEQNQRIREHEFGHHHDRGHEYEPEQRRPYYGHEQRRPGYEGQREREYDRQRYRGYEEQIEREYVDRHREEEREHEELIEPYH